jgi:hypothetical protein
MRCELVLSWVAVKTAPARNLDHERPTAAIRGDHPLP